MGWVVNATCGLLYSMETDPVPIIQEAEWAPGLLWTGTENLAPPPGFDLWTVHPIVNSVLAMLSLHIHFVLIFCTLQMDVLYPSLVSVLPSTLYPSVYKLLKALEYKAFGCV